tara:strand:+ start:105 stop:374 length:270 start_codon:yes stop_codon:yes gene_type:complete
LPKKESKQVDVVIDYKTVFTSEAGQRVLYDLMKNNYMLSPTYTSDINEMALREGARNSILRIMHILKIDVNKMNDLIQKGLEREDEYTD